MSYSFVKVTTYYRDFLHQYHQKFPEVQSLSYNAQHEHLMQQAYGWSDFYARNLRKRGVDTHEIVANAQGIQEAWSSEQGLKVNGKEIVLEQIRHLRPDVVFFQDSFEFNGPWINRLRDEVPSIKLVLGWCCAPFSREDMEQFRTFDHIFVCIPNFREMFKSLGFSVYEIHHAFEHTLLPSIQSGNNYPRVDLVFLGSLIAGSAFHGVRKRLLDTLLESDVSFDLYANIPSVTAIRLFLQRCAYVFGKTMRALGMRSLAESIQAVKKASHLREMPQRLPSIENLRSRSKPPLYGLEMLKALSRSRIGFNNHGEVAGDYAGNVRMFEITGVGSCMLTDRKKNINDFFKEDQEAVTYSSAEECVEKVKWLLDHPKEREFIAKSGQARTLRDHTYEVRAAQLDDIIRKELAQRGSRT